MCWIKTVTNEPVGDREQIQKYALRQVRMVRRLGGRFAVFKTESRFVTGLGRSHPVENGFAWHPTLGTPYLAGSSLKGLLHAWTRQDPDLASRKPTQVFGEQNRAGGICFFDAVPIKQVTLEADVMTPHYAGWTPEEPPGDWRSPIPIPFLVTQEKTPFLFGFAPCRQMDDGYLDDVWAWLCAALEWAGGGAKTAVGYGRFGHDVEQTQKFKDEMEREEARKTPEGRWRLKLEGKSENEVLDRVRHHLEKEPLTEAAERQTFARAVLTLHPDWVKAWRSGKPSEPGTNVGKKKLKERARLIDKALAETGANGNSKLRSG